MTNTIYHQYRLRVGHLCETLGLQDIHWYARPCLIPIATQIMSYLDQQLYPHKCWGQAHIINRFLSIMQTKNDSILGVDLNPVLPSENLSRTDASILSSIKFLPLSLGKFRYADKTVTYECPESYWTELDAFGIKKAEADIIHFINGLHNPDEWISEIQLGNDFYHYIRYSWENDRRNILSDEALKIIRDQGRVILVINGERILLETEIIEPEEEILNNQDEPEESHCCIGDLIQELGLQEYHCCDIIFTWTSIISAIWIQLHYTWPGLFVQKDIKYNDENYYTPETWANDRFWFDLK